MAVITTLVLLTQEGVGESDDPGGRLGGRGGHEMKAFIICLYYKITFHKTKTR